MPGDSAGIGGKYGRYVLRYDAGGRPDWAWERFNVPRINDRILGSAAYLFSSATAARSGDRGASGFLAAVFDEDEGFIHVYAVTAGHVIAQGFTTIRINTLNGRVNVLERRAHEWIRHPDGDDLGVCPIEWSPEEYGLTSALPTDFFMSRETLSQKHIGPGDEVFMNGRFLANGETEKDRNLPMLRFGNIAAAGVVPIQNSCTGMKQESFLVEMRSVSGYSGSPVFVYRLPFAMRPDSDTLQPDWECWLLGVDWGHLPRYDPVRDASPEAKPHPDGWRVASSSAMSGVVPAWSIMEILNLPELKEQRKEQSARLQAAERAHAEFIPDRL